MPAIESSAPMTHWFLATANRGAEPWLVSELEGLGASDVEEVPGGARFRGELLLGLRACLWLRTAHRVMIRIGRAEVSGVRSIYEGARSLPIADWFSPDLTLSVHADDVGRAFRDPSIIALKTKDAIVDVLREREGRRPNVDRRDADTSVYVVVEGGVARWFVELQGEALFHRGYRRMDLEPPLRETLAAALLMFSGWNCLAPLHDPMCGSGTILIEAALMATDTAPGLERSFAFQRWPRFEREWSEAWDALVADARARRQPRARGVIIGSDRAREAITAARANAGAAGVFESIEFRQQDVAGVGPLILPGWFVTNPPVPNRSWDEEAVDEAWSALHDAVRSCPGHHLAVVGGRDRLRRNIRLKPERSRRVRTGREEAEFALYSIFDPTTRSVAPGSSEPEGTLTDGADAEAVELATPPEEAAASGEPPGTEATGKAP